MREFGKEKTKDGLRPVGFLRGGDLYGAARTEAAKMAVGFRSSRALGIARQRSAALTVS